MRKGSIKCIPTEYDGITFRSKTEALFAKWCDLCKLKWHYEPEGFEGKTKYLPDFYLPEIKCFVEIKPPMFLDEIVKMKEMITDEQFASHTFLVATMYKETLEVIYLWEVWDIEPDNSVTHKYEDKRGWCMDATWCGKCFKPIFCAEGSYQCRGCGEYDGMHHLRRSPWEVEFKSLGELFKNYGN